MTLHLQGQSTQTFAKAHKAARISLCQILRSLLWDIFERMPRSPFALTHGICMSKHQLIQTTTEHWAVQRPRWLHLQVRRWDAPCLKQVENAASVSQLWYDTQGWGWAAFQGIVKVGKHLQDGVHPFWDLYPHRVTYYLKEWTLMEIAAWNR